MTLQNRVTPFGGLIATPERGLVYGNRGCLHDADRRIRRQFQVKRWIACRLEFRGRRRADVMPPGRYTGLFFLDDATAFSAGHRPCAECRREDYDRYREIWGGKPRADDMDGVLHAERMAGPHAEPFDELPDGAFALEDDEPWLVLGDELLRWTPGGYAERRARLRGDAAVITPAATVRVLRAGWTGDVPFLHPSAGRQA
ncbi:MAG: hypothetical protein ACRDNM_16420 [Gaiellaceae bacterium]